MQEKRLAPRRIFHAPLTIILASGQIFQARSYDLATGGLAALSSQQLQVDIDCSLYFDLPATATTPLQSLQLAARIVYSQPGASGYKHGLQFIQLKAMEQRLLAEFLATLSG